MPSGIYKNDTGQRKRPRAPRKTSRPYMIGVNLCAQEYEEIQRRARNAGIPMGVYCRIRSLSEESRTIATLLKIKTIVGYVR